MSTRPHHLLVDLQDRPVGVDPTGMRLSWRLPALGDRQQRGWQVQVAAAPRMDTVLWDSGEIAGTSSTGVSAAVEGLGPSAPYWWRVRTWMEGQVEPSDWSERARFVTALDHGWPARDIWAPGGTVDPPSWVLLRTEVELPPGKVLAAFVEASGQSPELARQYVYKLWCNGVVVGRGSVRPIAEEIRYHTHDVTDLLAPGADNALAALCWTEREHRFAARLVVLYEDGTRLSVPTSSDWQASTGEQLLPGADILEGGWYRAPREHWDMRHEPVGWTEPGFDDGDWATAVEREPVAPPLPATVNLGQHDREVADVRDLGDGRWFVDLCQEIAGGLRLSVTAPASCTLRLVLGEELDGDAVLSPLRTGNVYDETWTLRPGQQTIENWGFRGFRYAEITTEVGIDLIGAVTAVEVRSAAAAPADRARFDCADPELVRVWELCRRTIELTAMDLYIDTPVRERGPYEGDMYVNQLSQYAVGGGLALARYSGELLTRRPTWPSEYQLMPPICGWTDYLATGDDRQLQRDYVSWCDAMLTPLLDERPLVRKEPGPASGWGADLVDWPMTNRDGYVFTEASTVLNAFQCAAYRALAGIASVLGRPDDQVRFGSLADRMQAALTEHLLDEQARAYRDGVAVEHHAQHATAVPVALGLAPPASLHELGETLAAQGMRTSIYAAQLLLDALYACGQPDAARALMTAPGTPGWVDVMDRLGATLTPEAWDPSLKPNMTFSHAWGTAPANVVMRHLVGVQVVEPGAARVLVHPQPGSLTWFEAAVPTIRGPVAVAFRRDPDGGATTRVELPPGMVGTLVLPGAEAGTPPVDLPPGVTEVRQE